MRSKTWLCVSAFSLAILAAACGDDDGDAPENTSGSSGKGGSSAAGKGGSAGSSAGKGGSSQAGSSQAGSSQAGSSQAGSSQAGSGGSSQAGSGGSSQAGSGGSSQAGSGGSSQAGSGGSSQAGAGGSSQAGSSQGGSGPGKGGCGDKIFDASGALDADEYRLQATKWDAATINCRLGPGYEELHPGQNDTAPTAPEPEHKTAANGYLCKTYELGNHDNNCPGSKNGCDFGSTAGQVLYAAEAGVDRVQTYGYEKAAICESPQAGGWLGGPHPDPAIGEWTKKLGHALLAPIGFGQTEMNETNGGILIFPDGLVGATGHQTSGTSYPYFQLPKGKVPTSVTLTTYNEFALVTVWDTEALKGQLAVFALRSVKPEAFTIPYFAMPNEAGFTSIHLMGYIDLPDLKAPTSVSVSGNNGATPGGHAIGNEFIKDGERIVDKWSGFSRDDSERWVADSGTAVVASRWEDKVTFVDMRPLFSFVRDVYFTTDDKFKAASNKEAWPYTFDTNPEAKPVPVTTLAVTRPTASRVGNQVGAFPKGLQTSLHAFVANEAGEVRLFDISSFEKDVRPVPPDSIKEIAKVQAGKNITAMGRSTGSSYNRSVVVVSRGDRAVQWLSVGDSALSVSREIRDSRLLDPVAIDPNDRGPVVTVGDFNNKKILTFRFGPTENNAGKAPANYGCGPGGADASCASGEFAGELSYPGPVFLVSTSNVN